MPGAIGKTTKVDPNTAGERELANVGGLELAPRISQNRPFHSWEDLRHAGAKPGTSAGQVI